MKHLTMLKVVIYTALFLTSTPLIAQLQNSTTNQVNPVMGIGNQYFIDEAGLQLLQTANPLDNFIDESNYYLGPYDVLSIYGTGLVEFSNRGIVINASGLISTPLLGSISLKGLSLAEAKNVIQEVSKSKIKDTEVFVTLDQPRPVSLHIGGNIPNPGRYIIPAGTRYDALVKGFLVEEELITPLTDQSIQTILESSSQRPSYSGLNFDKMDARQRSESEFQNEELVKISQSFDLRLIKVKPLNGEEYYVDLAGYFNSGNPEYAPFIQDGDHVTLINTSSTRAKVSISGAVNNSFTGSYRSDDTFESLLEIAGGYQPNADTSSLVLIRLENNSWKQVDIKPRDLTNIMPGDQIIIKHTPVVTNYGSVTIEGEIELPGTFTISENETSLQELLALAGGLTENALPNAGYMIRNSKDNRGVNSVSSVDMYLLGRSSDQYLEGFDYLEMEQALDPNRMALHLDSTKVLEETLLQDGDHIYIPKDPQTISILGQVNVPGFYIYDRNLTIEDYLANANGLTIAANPKRIFIIKAGSKSWYKPTDSTIESGDIIFIDRVPFEDVSTGRNYQVEIERLKSERTRLILQGITAVTSIVTAYVAVRRLN